MSVQRQCPNCGSYKSSDADFEAKSGCGWLFYLCLTGALVGLLFVGTSDFRELGTWLGLIATIAAAVAAYYFLKLWKSPATRLTCNVCGQSWTPGVAPAAPVVPKVDLINQAAADEAKRTEMEGLDMLRRQATNEWPYNQDD